MDLARILRQTPASCLPRLENLIGSISTAMGRILKCFSFAIILVVALKKTKQAASRDCSIYICHLAKLNSH